MNHLLLQASTWIAAAAPVPNPPPPPADGVLASIWLWTLSAIWFVILVSIIAIVHELGHHVMCKLSDVRVDEFSIGWGRAVWTRKLGETEYNVRIVPIAAYVRPAGMDPEEDQQEGFVDPGPRSFACKSSPVKYLILVAGSLFNILLTIGILTGYYAVVGDARTTIQVRQPYEGWPAQRAGIGAGDIFLSLDGKPIESSQSALHYLQEHPNIPVRIVFQRGGQQMEVTVAPRLDEGSNVGRLGVEVEPYELAPGDHPLGLLAALSRATEESIENVQWTYGQILGVFRRMIVRREVPREIGGPVQIVATVKDVVKSGGWQRKVQLLAILSLAIGVFNLLPIFALDGGRIFVQLVRDLLAIGYIMVRFRKPAKDLLSPQAEERVHYMGILCLLFLLILVTIKDVREQISPPPPPSLAPIPVSPSAEPVAQPHVVAPSGSPVPYSSASASASPSPSPSPGR